MRRAWAVLLGLAGALGLLAIGVPAGAQGRGGGSGAGGAGDEPPPILRAHPIDRRDWTLFCEVGLFGAQTRNFSNEFPTPTQPVAFDSAVFVFPVIAGTSMSRTDTDKARVRIRVDGRVLDLTPRILEGYQGPTRLAALDVGETRALPVRLEARLPMTCWDTSIDEKRAMGVPWPEKPWSPEIALNLQPQLFVESDHPEIRALVEKWAGPDVRKYKPYELAKVLAAAVIDYYQPNGGPIVIVPRGPIRGEVSGLLASGLRVEGALAASREGRGSPLDMSNLLTALYRAAGLPARVVVAYELSGRDAGMDRGPGDNPDTRERPQMKAWTEFYLLDERVNPEKGGRGEWIPVDVQRQRQMSSRAPPTDRPWPYFGNNRGFRFTAPIAFHWHPPTVVTNAFEYPGLWGWLPLPAVPRTDTALNFRVIGTPRGGGGEQGW
ncbi:MAG: transglutaminase domain-containing protein [Phycisphaerales bacterium]|nr:transglutaminase domain-containing protein [Phycisphaerales bacterium]